MGETRRNPVPSVRARRAGELLREAREQANLKQDEVAERLGWTQSGLSHYETARRLISVKDAEQLLDLYDVPTGEREIILQLVRDGARRGWWMNYSDVIGGPFIELEDTASGIEIWDDRVIPGLFQTQQYARAIMSARGHIDNASIDRKLRARANRQELVTREGAPQIRVVLDEAALERPVGGEEVFRGQLQRLAFDAALPNVDLRILPKGCGTHPGLDGSFIVLRFDPPFRDVAYIEGMHGATYLESPPSVAECSLAFGGLVRLALNPESSRQLITAAAERR